MRGLGAGRRSATVRGLVCWARVHVLGINRTEVIKVNSKKPRLKDSNISCLHPIFTPLEHTILLPAPLANHSQICKDDHLQGAHSLADIVAAVHLGCRKIQQSAGGSSDKNAPRCPKLTILRILSLATSSSPTRTTSRRLTVSSTRPTARRSRSVLRTLVCCCSVIESFGTRCPLGPGRDVEKRSDAAEWMSVD